MSLKILAGSAQSRRRMRNPSTRPIPAAIPCVAQDFSRKYASADALASAAFPRKILSCSLSALLPSSSFCPRLLTQIRDALARLVRRGFEQLLDVIHQCLEIGSELFLVTSFIS